MSRTQGTALLGAAVDRFCAGVTASLLHVTEAGDTGVDVSDSDLAGDVAVEAYRIACAFIDSDGRHSDDELLPLIATFGGRFDTQLSGATPGQVRDAALLRGAARWLDRPSDLFEILLGADRAEGSDHALGYYRHAMGIAHTIVALDVISTEGELAAIERYRDTLLARIGPARSSGSAPVGGDDHSDPARGQADPVEPDGAAEPLPPPRPLEELMAELDDLIGLAEVKAEVRRITDLIRVGELRAQVDLPVAERSNHLVFTGNPGTGKTTVARLLAQIYRTLGVVERGHLIEVDRSSLVAGFVGAHCNDDVRQPGIRRQVPVLDRTLWRGHVLVAAGLDLGEVFRVADHRFLFEIAHDPMRRARGDQIQHEEQVVEDALGKDDQPALEAGRLCNLDEGQQVHALVLGLVQQHADPAFVVGHVAQRLQVLQRRAHHAGDRGDRFEDDRAVAVAFREEGIGEEAQQPGEAACELIGHTAWRMHAIETDGLAHRGHARA